MDTITPILVIGLLAVITALTSYHASEEDGAKKAELAHKITDLERQINELKRAAR